jgi:hypothetical protein
MFVIPIWTKINILESLMGRIIKAWKLEMLREEQKIKYLRATTNNSLTNITINKAIIYRMITRSRLLMKKLLQSENKKALSY